MDVKRAADAYAAFLARWVEWTVAHARLVAIGGLALTVLSVVYFVANVGINTSTSDMLSKDLPFRQKSREIDAAFPQTDSTLVVVIDGQTADIADDAALALGAALRAAPEQFSDVYDLQGDAFFRRNGLLYLDLDELNELSDRLVESQPFLSTLWRDSNVRGFFRMLGLAIDDALAPGGGEALNLTQAMTAIADVADAQRDRRFQLLSWTGLMGGKDATAADRRRFIVVQPVRDHGSMQPTGDAISRIRAMARELRLTPERGLRVRLTGSAALDEEELQSVETGMGTAAIVSLVLVLGLLAIGLKSPILVAASLATLIAGLSWTAAFAVLAVGTLNLISVAFAVLFIGLSVDFGIHFALRYQEELWRGFDQPHALSEAARGTGGALTLSAISAAVAFYAFLPTDYVGLAELGLIAGTGMFIALFANLTLLPALICMRPLRGRLREARPVLLAGGVNLAPLTQKNARIVCAAAVVLGVGAAMMIPRVAFDFDPLNLKDPGTESVSTLLDLVGDGSRHHHTIDILAPSLAKADALAVKLRSLDEVDQTRTLSSFVAENQDEKLAVIADLGLLIAPGLSGADRQNPLTSAQRRAAWDGLRPKLAALENAGVGDVNGAAKRLLRALANLLNQDADGHVLLELENRLLTGLPGRLDALSESLEAEAFGLADLPRQLHDRNIAADGRALIEVVPQVALNNRDDVRGFVDAVRTVAPDAVGSPVVILEAGRTVLGAFALACVIAVGVIAVLLSFVMGAGRQVGLVFAPLFLAAVWTMAAATLIGEAFNLANVIVLPLLFGLGVAGNIHLVSRARHGQVGEAMQTSTPRAILFSALTTIGSFGSISLSAHPGTASMGTLLTLALTMTLLATLVFLPAVLALVYARDET